MLLCIAKEASFEQTTLNKILHTEENLLNCFIVCLSAFPINSLDKASGLPYIFMLPMIPRDSNLLRFATLANVFNIQTLFSFYFLLLLLQISAHVGAYGQT